MRKRFGIGYTLNFGNRCSWAILGLVLFAILFPFSIPVAIGVIDPSPCS